MRKKNGAKYFILSIFEWSQKNLFENLFLFKNKKKTKQKKNLLKKETIKFQALTTMARIQSSMYSCSVLVFVLMICGVDAFDALVSHFSVLCLLSSLPSDLLSTVLLVLLFVELLLIEPPFVGSFRLYRNLIILFCFAFFSPFKSQYSTTPDV